MDDRYSTPVMEGTAGSAGDPQDPATQRLQDAATGLVDQAREAAVSQANTGVEAATDRLQHVAHAVRQTSQSLREQDQPQIAMLADKAAEQVERASGYFAGKDVRDLAGEVERFARREPALFVAGGLTLGLLAARFLKSSPPSRQPIPADRALQPYGGGYAQAPRMGYADTSTGVGAYAGAGYAGSAIGGADPVGVMSDDVSGTAVEGYDGFDGQQEQSELERLTGISSQSSEG